MRIGFNLLPLVPDSLGGRTYVAALLQALVARAPEHTYIAFIGAANTHLLAGIEGVTVVPLAAWPRLRPMRVLYENLVFPWIARRWDLTCMHHPLATLPLWSAGNSVVTVYDLMVFERPGAYGFVRRRYLQAMLRRIAGKATVITPISHSTHDSIMNQLGVPRERLVIVPPVALEDMARPRPAAVSAFRRLHALPDEFWLCVAQPVENKNFPRLLAAYADLRKSGKSRWPLVIRATPTPSLLQLVERLGLKSHVSFLHFLPREEMPLLYSAASALVFPSLFEGAGLPVVEAMACGCPVVASSIATTAEFAGAAALTFDPRSASSIAAAMHRCETDPQRRAQLAKAGPATVARYTQSELASESLRAYSLTTPVSGQPAVGSIPRRKRRIGRLNRKR